MFLGSLAGILWSVYDLSYRKAVEEAGKAIVDPAVQVAVNRIKNADVEAAKALKTIQTNVGESKKWAADVAALDNVVKAVSADFSDFKKHALTDTMEVRIRSNFADPPYLAYSAENKSFHTQDWKTFQGQKWRLVPDPKK